MPELLIMESPTEGFDYMALQSFNRLIRVMADLGTTIIIVSLRPSELAYSAQQVMLYNGRGRCLHSGRAAEIIEREAGGRIVVRVTPAKPQQIAGNGV